jgi:hypothetical protein
MLFGHQFQLDELQYFHFAFLGGGVKGGYTKLVPQKKLCWIEGKVCNPNQYFKFLGIQLHL